MRKGKEFKFGWPHFYGGVDYSFPNRERNYGKLLLEKSGEVGDLLLKNLKEYINKFKVSTSCK